MIGYPPSFKSFLLAAWLLIAFALGLSTLFGCSFPAGVESLTPTTLTLSTWGSTQELATLRQQLDHFEEKHPHIRVKVSHIPDSYLAKLHLMAVSHLLPDVMLMNSWQIPRFANHGLLEPLPLSTASAHAFFPTALKSLQVNGKQMALPRDVSTLVVLVNTDVLKRLGVSQPSRHWTMEEKERLSQSIRLRQKKHKAHPNSLFTAKVYPQSFYREPSLYWLPWVWSNGGQLWDSQGCLALHTPKASRALADYMRLSAKGDAPLRKDWARTTMTQLFLQQRMAFLVTGRWTVPLLREQAHFKWGVWPLPAGPAGSITGVDATGYAIAKASLRPKEALELVNFLTSDKVLYAQAQSGLLVPARTEVAKRTFVKEPNFYRVVQESIATGQPTLSHPHWPEVEASLATALEPYWDTSVTSSQLAKTLSPLHQRFCPNKKGQKR